jgi:hypothetical protein
MVIIIILKGAGRGPRPISISTRYQSFRQPLTLYVNLRHLSFPVQADILPHATSLPGNRKFLEAASRPTVLIICNIQLAQDLQSNFDC